MSNKSTEPEALKVIDEVVETVKTGKAQEIVTNFWANNKDELIDFGKILLLSLIVLLIAWCVTKIAKKMIFKAEQKISVVDSSLSKVLYGIVRTFIGLFTFLIILDLFGINTASILTVLGAAGLAVGLAMKDSLSNIAAGLMLLILRPYHVGDYVDCGSISGTIKDMGLFTTTLETIDGIFLAAPNSVLFGTPVKNYSRNPIRRADITVGIAYEDSLQQGIKVLHELMANNELILKDPVPEVLVADLADSSVNLTLRFWTKTENYWQVYWEVKAELKNTIESAGLNIPFPQRVVTMVNNSKAE